MCMRVNSAKVKSWTDCHLHVLKQETKRLFCILMEDMIFKDKGFNHRYWCWCETNAWITYSTSITVMPSWSSWPSRLSKKTQNIQNVAAHLVFNQTRRTYATPPFIELHWRTVDAGIKRKLMILARQGDCGVHTCVYELSYKGLNPFSCTLENSPLPKMRLNRVLAALT